MGGSTSGTCSRRAWRKGAGRSTAPAPSCAHTPAAEAAGNRPGAGGGGRESRRTSPHASPDGARSAEIRGPPLDRSVGGQCKRQNGHRRSASLRQGQQGACAEAATRKGDGWGQGG